MIGSFKQYLVEEEKTVFFSFGRMNPPTIGHGKLLDTLSSSAGKNPYRMYLSQSTDSTKNPLQYKDKVKFVRKMFPRHARNVLLDSKIKSVFDALVSLYNEGYRKVVMVVGSDRVREFDILLKKYNGQKGKHGFYNFMDIKIISAGHRDPDSEGVEGMSASKMRQAAKDNDFTSFAQGLPQGFSNSDSKTLFNTVRTGMGLKESSEYRKHIQLEPVSEIRESYVDGKLFEIGDKVVIKENGEIGVVKRLGTNYVIIESKSNEYRKWLDAIEKVEQKYPEYTVAPFSVSLSEATMNVNEKIQVRQDPDIDDRKGSQPATFQMGIKSKSTKAARDAHFKKMSKRDDHGNPDLYKDAPGDKKARAKGTKPSPYTMRFKAMYGEETDPVDIAKQRINREKKADAQRHDRMMDRARTKATNMKNKETKANG